MARSGVGVHLEDLLLGETCFELEGDEDLDELALDAALGREKDAARELHSEGGAAAGPAAVSAEVVPGPADHAVVVNASVIEEAAVFDGGNGLHETLRNLVVADEAALGAVLVFRERGDELGLQLVGAEGDAGFGGDLLDYAAGGGNGGAVSGVEALWAGFDEDVIAIELEGTQLGIAVVAGLAEVSGDGGGRELLAVANLARKAID